MKIPPARVGAPRVLPTAFDGWYFRSRLEARWAVVFKAAGIRYQYEYELFMLPNGEGYLPDFWLPELRYHVEVKPDGGDFSKARALASYGVQVMLLEGAPENIEYTVLNGDSCTLYAENLNAATENDYWLEVEHSTDSFFTFPESAIEAGRTARFEHHQIGGVRAWA
jgi:hypothetical protein